MMGEEERLPSHSDELQESEHPKKKMERLVCGPVYWFKMLAEELHWSFVFGVIMVYGMSQGLGGALARVGTEYYMKDVQKVQPSEAQVYSGITSIPWIVKPLWGLLTDVVPISGYQRRPYFVFAGSLGVVSMLFISLHKNLHIVLALLSLTGASARVAISDVTVDACVAQKSGIHPSLAADMQSLCTLSSSIVAFLGFSVSGVFVHLIGPQGVFGLLTIPAGLVFLVGVLLKERRASSFAFEQINENFLNAGKSVWKTLKYPDVWRPCLYMYLSFALSLRIDEGMFYWATDSPAGPMFSKLCHFLFDCISNLQQAIGYIMAIGSIGYLLGAILYQYGLKDYLFRNILFWAQILSCLSGMLDLALVLRWNLKLGIPDYVFVVMDASVSQLIWCLRRMPLLVISSKICPPGIEGTFFALLMSIENAGPLTSSWLGGLLLHMLNVSRTQFDNLWLAILIWNISRISPLFLLFLVPRSDPTSHLLPDEIMNNKRDAETRASENVELVALVNRTDDR